MRSWMQLNVTGTLKYRPTVIELAWEKAVKECGAQPVPPTALKLNSEEPYESRFTRWVSLPRAHGTFYDIEEYPFKDSYRQPRKINMGYVRYFLDSEFLKHKTELPTNNIESGYLTEFITGMVNSKTFLGEDIIFQAVKDDPLYISFGKRFYIMNDSSLKTINNRNSEEVLNEIEKKAVSGKLSGPEVVHTLAGLLVRHKKK